MEILAIGGWLEPGIGFELGLPSILLPPERPISRVRSGQKKASQGSGRREESAPWDSTD